MSLGWSTDGYGGLRATNADRKAAARLVDTAFDEGRLDSVEHAQRSDAVRVAKTRADLALLTADLPARRGATEWIDEARVRDDDREQAARWLAGAAARGRLTATECQHRMAILAEVDTYAGLKGVLEGLPDWPGAPAEETLAGDGERDAALAALTEAVVAGRVGQRERPVLEAGIRQARRVADLEALLAPLAVLATDEDRDRVVQEVEAAHLAGQLDAGDRATRVDLAKTATTNVDLSRLVADLRGGDRRLTQIERDQGAARLKRETTWGRFSRP